MKNNSVYSKFFFILLLQCIALAFLVMQTLQSQTLQVKIKPEILEAARMAFSGNDSGQKRGPLAKMGFDLALLREEFRDHAALQTLTPFKPSNSLLHVSDNRVVVDIIAQVDAASIESDLIGLGMQISGKAGAVVSGLLPITSIEAVAALQNVRFARPAMWKTNIGLTTSQGDVSMRSNIARTNNSVDGTGITVGVLSDSYNYLGGATTNVSSGDLPGTGNPYGHTTPVNVLADDGTTDEGRGMLQLVHDVAPGANLAFATANGGQAAFANNITNLRTTAGAKVIVDDVSYYAEPMFQDGVIAQAVDATVAAGVPYFSSAGNEARQSYESVWRSGPVLAQGAITGDYTFWGGTTFDFDPSPGIDNMQAFTIGAGETVIIVLQWDSPFASVCSGCPGSANDLDIYLLNSAGNYVYLSSDAGNINGDAVEVLGATNNGASALAVNLMIVKYSGSDPGFLKYVNVGDAQGSLEYATNSSTIYGHANAAGAEAVGAARYSQTPAFGVTPPVLEYFSSVGPTAIRFNTSGAPISDPRANKPEITAPDGANTTFFGQDYEPDGFPNFFGTSAAAPHAAAVAALMLNAKSTATPSQIYSKLEATAIDMGTAGFDNNSGFGLIQADAAINSLLPVEIVSFTAATENINATLRWATATETNNYGFEVERRAVSNQPITLQRWQKIGFVQGNGSCNVTHHYSFTDQSLASGRYAYRLKQVDNNGAFKYSGEAEITIAVPKAFFLDQNYPNPFNPTTNLKYQLAAAGYVSLKVYDLLGHEVAVLVDETKEAGNYEVMFDASHLASGIYFSQLKSNGQHTIKKMILMK